MSTALVFRYERRPTRLLAHNRDDTSMIANSQIGRLLPPMNVKSSSAWSSTMSKSVTTFRLNLSAAFEARSSQRATGVAGTTGETGRGRNAHALDSQARYLVELCPSAAKTAVRCPRIRAGRYPAYLATVPASSTRLGGKPAVATDVDAQLSKVLAPWIRACLVLERPHRSSVPGLKPAVSPTILRYLRATDQQRMAQAPTRESTWVRPWQWVQRARWRRRRKGSRTVTRKRRSTPQIAPPVR